MLKMHATNALSMQETRNNLKEQGIPSNEHYMYKYSYLVLALLINVYIYVLGPQ